MDVVFFFSISLVNKMNTICINSFSKEFASEACDGVSLLLDILRAIQMVQADLSGRRAIGV